jgi:lipoprotein NlpD
MTPKTNKKPTPRLLSLGLLLFVTFFLSSCFSTHGKGWNWENEKRGNGKGVYHTVKRGQTLWRISYTYGVPLQEVAEANGIRNPTKIRVGQKVFIPGASKVRRIKTYIPPPKKGETKVVIKKGRFAWPLKGQILSKFGPRKSGMHYGLDIRGKRGTPIKASESGKVVYSDNGMRGYGNVIILEHTGGYYTVYSHNDKNIAKAGAKVKKGETIATVGDSGNATTEHLHFEIRTGKKSRNPLFFLP